jgi:hypothetical protein
VFFSRYQISRGYHAEIQDALMKRHSEGLAHGRTDVDAAISISSDFGAV